MARYLIAGILIILGIGFLLDQTNVWNFGSIIGTWWPLVIIAIGIIILSKSTNSIATGLIILVVGILLQITRIYELPGGFWGVFWPLALISIGLWILFSRFSIKKHKQISDDILDISLVFSGIEQRIESDDFKGGQVTAIFGGAKLDLRDVKVNTNSFVLELSVTFAGIELIVPSNWRLDVKGLPLFGGIDDQTRKRITDEPTIDVKVKYFATFGGIEIKN